MKKKLNLQNTGNAQLDAALLEIINFVNSLADSVNNFQTTKTETGSTGDFRVVNDINNKPKIQVKGKDGWYEIRDLEEVKK